MRCKKYILDILTRALIGAGVLGLITESTDIFIKLFISYVLIGAIGLIIFKVYKSDNSKEEIMSHNSHSN